MLRPGQTHPTETCDLAGRRIAVGSEIEDGRRFAESLVKQLTGGEDTIKGRRMREDFWEFRATHKLWLCGNHKPRVAGDDDGIWDRIRLVPFNVRFWDPDCGETGPEELRVDKSLATTLDAELPGILAWAVRGCLDWQRHGLGATETVKTATAEYRAENDDVGQFIDQCCVVAPAAKCRGGDLFEAYRRWAGRSSDRRPCSPKKFGQAMKKRFDCVANNGIWYLGIGIMEHQTEGGTEGTEEYGSQF